VTVGVSENVSERDDEISSEGDCLVCEGESVSVGDCVTLPLPLNEGESDRDSSSVSVATDSVTLRETLGDRVPRDRVPDFVKLIEILLDAEGVVLSELLRTSVDEGVTVSSSESESDGDALAIGDGVTPLGVSEMEFVLDRDFSSVAVVVYDGVALHDRDWVTSSDGVLLGEDSSEKEGELEAVSEGDTEVDNDPEPVGVPDSVRVRDPRDSVTVPVTVSEGVLSWVKDAEGESVMVLVSLKVIDDDTVFVRDSEISLLDERDGERSFDNDFDIVCSEELEIE
jgi:hypothetical protein